MADPIAALKALIDISKLKSGEDAAAEYLSKVRDQAVHRKGMYGKLVVIAKFCLILRFLLLFWITIQKLRYSKHLVLDPWFQDRCSKSRKRFAATYTLVSW